MRPRRSSTSTRSPTRRPRRRDAVRAGFGCVKAKAGLDDDATRLRRDPRRDRARRGAADRRQRRLDRGRGDRAARGARAAGPRARRGARPRRHGAARAARPHVGAACDGRDRRAAARARRSWCASRSRARAASAALLAKAAFCHAVGEEVYLASTLDGPLGIAAAHPLRGGAADRAAVRTGHARPARRGRSRGVRAGRRTDRGAAHAGTWRNS